MTLPIAEVEADSCDRAKSIARVIDLARTQIDLSVELALLEKEVKAVTDKIDKNVKHDLPLAMTEAGLGSGFKLSNGAEIVVKPIVQTYITEANQPAAHQWLEDNQAGGLIKRMIQILFGKEDTKWAAKFLRDCEQRKRKLNLKTKEWVEPQTLKAFVREKRKLAIAANRNPDEAVPQDLFSVYVADCAVVKMPESE